jgi:hypothetical protein
MNMSIQVGNYHAEGPFGNANALHALSGVYVILGRRSVQSGWIVLDVGESKNIRDRVNNHDRAPEWQRQGHAELAIAAIYADERNRMLIERQLRVQFNPMCGVY